MDAPAFPRGRGDEPEVKHKASGSGSSSRPARPASSSHRLFAAKKEAPAAADGGKGADGKRRRAKSEGKRPAAAAAVAAAVEEAAASSHAAKRADELTFKRLHTGTVMLCRVRRVGAHSAALSLPHGLTGQVALDATNDVLAATVRAGGKGGGAAADDSDDEDAAAPAAAAAPTKPTRLGMHSYLVPGQYVMACVTRVGSESLFDTKPAALALAQSLSASASGAGKGGAADGKRIELSLRPELCNQGLTLKELRNGSLVHGYVRSVEDHGYVVATGIAGATAFLPFANCDGTAGQAGTTLSRQVPGAPITALVWAINRDSGVVTLACHADRVATLVSREPLHTIYTIKPGQLVTVTVDKALNNGLAVTFLAFFHGSVHMHHLPAPAHALWAADYPAGTELRARILYVDPAEKVIALSAAPHVVSYGRDAVVAPAEAAVGTGGPSFDVGEGAKVPAATVLRVDPGVGMLIGWGSVDDALAAEGAAAAAAAAEAKKRAAKAAEKAAAKKKKKAAGHKRKHADGDDNDDDDGEEDGGDDEQAAAAAPAADDADADDAAAAPADGPAATAAALVAAGKKLPLETSLRVAAQWGRTAYVHISRAGVPAAAAAGKDGAKAAAAADEKCEHIERHYRPGQTVAARVLTFAGVEGHAVASTKASVVDAAVLRPSDVAPGAVMEGVVQEVLPGSGGGKDGRAAAKPVDFASGKGVVAIVRLGEGVTGVVTALHVADVLPSRSLTSPKQRDAFLKGVGLVPGGKVRVRVLSVDARRGGSIQLTMKKTLLGSTLPALTDYKQAYETLVALRGPQEGAAAGDAAAAPHAPPQPLVTHGFVTGYREAGVIVTFYSGASGFLPSSDLVEHGVVPKELAEEVPAPAGADADASGAAARMHVIVPIAALQRVYSQGAVVKVRVVSVATHKGRMRLSVGLSGAGGSDATAAAADAAASASSSAAAAAPALPAVEVPLPAPGTFANGTVVSADASKQRLLVKLTHVADEAGALAALPAGAALYADLPFVHLTDQHPGSSGGSAHPADAVAAAYPPGTPLMGLLVLTQLAQPKTPRGAGSLPTPSVLVTAKPLLRYAASPAPGHPSDMLPGSVDVLRPGLLVAGYVASVTAFAAFVRFLGGVTGAAPRSRWPAAADAASSSAHDEQYAVGQTVLAVVEKVTAGGDGADASRGRFTLSLLPAAVARMLPPTFFTDNAAPHGLSLPADATPAATASAAAAFLRGLLLEQELALAARAVAPAAADEDEEASEEEKEDEEEAGAQLALRPSRFLYRVGATAAARVKAVSGEGGAVIVELPAPKPAALPAGAPAAAADAALPPVLGFALSSGGAAPAVGSVVHVTVLDVNTGKGMLHVQLAATPAAGDAKPSKKRARPAELALPAAHEEVAPPAAVPPSLALGATVPVTVLHKPSPLYAVVQLADGSGAIGYAAVADLLADAAHGGAADVAVGGTYEAVVTQLPSDAAAADKPAPAGKGGKKGKAAADTAVSPATAASRAVGGLLLLTLVPSLLAARKGGAAGGKAGAPSKRTGGGSSARDGVAIEGLLPGMTVTARVRPQQHQQPAAAKAAKSSEADDSDADSDADSDSDAAAHAKKGGKKAGGPSGLAAAVSLSLVGVVGRYEAALSLAECVDVDPYSGKAAEDAASSLARYEALAAAAPGSEVRVKIVAITREMREPFDKRSRSAASSTADGAHVATVPFYRVAVTVRPSDLALPELHLASHRPAWAEPAPAGLADESAAAAPARLTSESCVVSASAAALAAAGPACVHAPAASQQSLVAGAVGYGVVEGVSPDGGYVWVGLGGGVHGRAFVLDCGDSDDFRDAATGAVHVTPAAAAALSAPRLGAVTHPLGSIVPVVLTAVDTARRRADVSIRAARAAAGVASSASGAAAAAKPAAKKAKKGGSDDAAAPAPSFAAAVAAVARWLAGRPDVGRPSPGQVVLAHVSSASGAAAPGARYPATAKALRLQLSSAHASHGRVDISHLADRAAWVSKPLTAFVEGQVVRAVVLPGAGAPPPSSAAAGSSSDAAASADLELSLRPSFLAAALEAAAAPAPSAAAGKRKRKESDAGAAAPMGAAGGLAAAAARLAAMDAEERAAASAAGAKVSGHVVSVSAKGCFVRLARGVTARVMLKLLSDAFVRAPAASFPAGKLVTGVITAADATTARYDMSLRLSDTDPAAAAAAAAGKGSKGAAPGGAPRGHLLGYHDLHAGLVLDGAVTKVADFGVFVALDGSDRNAPGPDADAKPAAGGRSGGGKPVPISGLVHVSEVDDVPAGKKAAGALAKLRTEMAARFAVGDRVRVVVTTVDAAEKKLALSMRPSRLEEAENAEDDGEEGAGSDEDGDDDEMIGLGGGVEGSDDEEEDGDDDDEEVDEEEDDEEEGDDDGDSDAEEDEDDDAEVAPAPASRKQASGRAAAGIFGALDDDEDSDADSDDDGEEVDAAPAARGARARAAPSSSAAAGGGDSDDDLDAAFADEDGSDDGEGGGSDGEGARTTASKAAKRRARARAAAVEEAETSRREQRLVTGEAEAAPETVEDFERLVAAQPHSSLAWIRYMAWQLSLSEVAKARAVAERALATISYRAEDEKLNVWTALLNLEATYGSPASLAAVFARAQQAADPKAVHKALLGVYQRGGADRAAETEALFGLTAKKFGRDDEDVWHQWAAFKFRRGDAAGARGLLPRAMQVLPKRKHVDLIARFALLEYSFAAPAGSSSDAPAAPAYGLGAGAGCGSQERGRTMLQGVLDAVPKRLDLWSVYLDQEIAAFARRHPAGAAAASGKGAAAAARDGSASSRTDDLAFVRSIFDRVLSLRHSSKKVKFLFKRYLSFEGAHGDASGVKRVQAAARAYVESLVAGGAGAGADAGSDDE